LRREKTGFEIAEICGGFGQILSFLLLKPVYERHANPNPFTPKEKKRQNYQIYLVGFECVVKDIEA
jgi:hypothetical protein